MKQKLKIFLIALLNAFVMLGITFGLMRSPYIQGDEQALIEYVGKIKNILLGIEEKPPIKDFMFVNIAYDRQLIDKLDTNGLTMGKQIIVDRYKLARFFEILAKRPKNQKFILCDIHLVDSVKNDSVSPDIVLANSLAKLPNSLIVYHLDETGKPEYPIFRNAKMGLADYTLVGEKFFKFTLFVNDTIKTAPLMMYEYLHQKKTASDSWSFFNTFIVDFRIRNYDLFFAKEHYKIDNLENILSGVMSEEQVLEYVKDRIIIIGDFELYDNHQTIYGTTAGSLILLNTYLGLVAGNNIIYISWLIFILCSYTLAVVVVFIPNTQEILWKRYIFDMLSYVTVLSCTSVFSFWFFNLPISIMYLVFYLFALKKLKNLWEQSSQKVFRKLK